jgi:hypothetical protein
MLQKNEKFHSEIVFESSLPLTNSHELRSVKNCHMVDALGLHVLVRGARERQVYLLDPLFKNSDNKRYNTRLDILVRSMSLVEESDLSKSHVSGPSTVSFDFLASIEPQSREASLLLEGRIVNPFSLLTTRQFYDYRESEGQITFVASFPTEDKALAAASLLLIQSIDDKLYETTDWQREEHEHFDTPLTRHTLSFRPRPTTLIFPLGAPSL